MCLGLSELREAVAVYAAGFDPRLLSGTDAARVVADAAAIENGQRLLPSATAFAENFCLRIREAEF